MCGERERERDERKEILGAQSESVCIIYHVKRAAATAAATAWAAWQLQLNAALHSLTGLLVHVCECECV